MQDSNSAILDIIQVDKNFGDFKALDKVNLTVKAGTVTCIIGPSGSGKSTLLRTINGLEVIDQGAIFFEGELLYHEVRRGARIPLSRGAARKHVLNFGMVFQQFNLFPNLSVLDNVMLAPRTVLGLNAKAARALSLKHLARVGLEDKTNQYPNSLSGGQQQRVGIARALAMNPRVMLFDEPTSALDPELVAEVLEVMRDLAADGTTMIVVTHEMGFARELADEVVFMAEGQVVETGPPADVLSRPKTRRARDFISAVIDAQSGLET